MLEYSILFFIGGSSLQGFIGGIINKIPGINKSAKLTIPFEQLKSVTTNL